MNENLEKLIRPHYRELNGYTSAAMESGKDQTKVFMNANENPFTLPGLEGMNYYPEPQPVALLAAFAKAYGVKPEQVFASRGSGEAIAILTRLFCDAEDAVITCPPTFAMFKFNAQAVPSHTIEVPLIKENGIFRLNKDEVVAKAQDPANKVKLVFLFS